ncbi:MAG: Rieske (2Fe-2S) protein [Roseateles sp.]|nr:MAG: Rieske (2Fe-2S) protein [Roseateles sp.]
MLEPVPAAQHLCASADLVERGRAVVFDVLQWHQPARAFALRYEGRAVAYLNRCAHVPTEMDWQEGEFLDGDKRFILCSIHGAAYEPLSGQCLMGPCRGARLTKIEISEREGQVYWHPTRDTLPAFQD